MLGLEKVFVNSLKMFMNFKFVHIFYKRIHEAVENFIFSIIFINKIGKLAKMYKISKLGKWPKVAQKYLLPKVLK